MVTSQAPKSRPCQVNVPMRRRARRNVSLVRSSAVACRPRGSRCSGRPCRVLVVEPAEGLGLAGLGAFDKVHHAAAVAVGGAAGGGRAGAGTAGSAGGLADRSAPVGQGVARAAGGDG